AVAPPSANFNGEQCSDHRAGRLDYLLRRQAVLDLFRGSIATPRPRVQVLASAKGKQICRKKKKRPPQRGAATGPRTNGTSLTTTKNGACPFTMIALSSNS